MREFGNNTHRFNDLEAKLARLQAFPHSTDNLQAQQAIQKEIAEALKREEMYLYQKFRVKWLQYEDYNSAFFHASVSQRRQHNQLIKLLDEEGRWLISDEDINPIFWINFQPFSFVTSQGTWRQLFQQWSIKYLLI